MGRDGAMVGSQHDRRALRLAIVCNLGYASLLVVAALIPRVPSVIPAVPEQDLLAHSAAYGLQAVLLMWLFRYGRLNKTSLAMLFAFTGAAIFGLFTELLQTVHPSRSAELSDFVADVIGAAVAVLAFRLVGDRARWWRADGGPGV